MSSQHIGIEEARKVLGDLVTAAQQGADIILTRNRRPVARITRYQEDAMKTWTLSTDLSRDSLLSVLADLDLDGLEPGSPSGFHSGVSLSMVGERDRPPTELQKVRAALIERGDRASY